MIESVFRGSFFGRVAAYLRKMYPLGCLAAFFRALAGAYSHSRLRRAVHAVMQSPSSTEASAYARRLNGLNRWLHRVGTGIEQAGKRSRVCRGIRAAGQSARVRGSAFCRFWARVRYRKPLLLLFSLFLPIDVFLRTVVDIAFLSALWDEAFLLFCLLALLAERMAARETLEARPTPLDVPILFFIALSFMLCMIVSPDMGIAVDGLRAAVQFMLWFFALSRLIRDDDDWLWFIIPLCLIAVLVSLHGLFQFLVGAPIPAHWVSQSEMGVRTRVFSIFGSPNIMGAFLVMTAPLCAAFAYMARGWGTKVIVWGAVALLCGACLFTFSRGAWIGLAVAVLLFALFVDRRILLIALLAGGVALFIPQVSNRITFLFTSDFAQRTMEGGRGERWAVGMQLLRSVNGWFGFGLGRFGGAVAMQNQVIESVKYFYLDNYYLKTLVEMGYLGLGGYLLLLCSTMGSGLRRIFQLRTTKLHVLAAALFSGMAGVLAHCYFENIFEVPYMSAYFWGMAAVLVTLGKTRAAARTRGV